MSRRRFVQAIGAAALATAARGARAKKGGSMPMRTLGRTGVKVSLLGLGGYHLGMPSEDKDAIRIMHAAIDHGCNFFDNCWDYNDGLSERRMGDALAGGRRQKVFLMTKLDGRTRDSAQKQLEQSLQRLKTDVIDLVQVHEVIRMDDAERCFAKGGAMEAFIAARQAGKLRFIGFTGHKDPAIHNHFLDVADKNGFAFDTVQLPLNVFDAHYKSFEREVLPRLTKKNIGVLGMKAIAGGLAMKSGAVRAEECLRYAMGTDANVVITGCDSMPILDQALSIAIDFRPLAPEEKKALLARTAPVAQGGKWERFKTSNDFDGTERNPHWLKEARL